MEKLQGTLGKIPECLPGELSEGILGAIAKIYWRYFLKIPWRNLWRRISVENLGGFLRWIPKEILEGFYNEYLKYLKKSWEFSKETARKNFRKKSGRNSWSTPWRNSCRILWKIVRKNAWRNSEEFFFGKNSLCNS